MIESNFTTRMVNERRKLRNSLISVLTTDFDSPECDAVWDRARDLGNKLQPNTIFTADEVDDMLVNANADKPPDRSLPLARKHGKEAGDRSY